MHFDTSLLKSSKVQNGLPDSDFNNPELLPHLEKINSKAQNHDYDFLNLLNEQTIIDQVKQTYAQFSWVKHLVVVGIGGSDLGGKTLKQSLANNNFPVTFIGDSTDPYPYYQLLKNINPQETLINIVSKSGSTTETAVGLLLLKKFYEDKGLDWSKHFVFTTDANSGILHDLASKHLIPTLPIPANVGGRYSVLTAVGLFPALFMGINIDSLLDSAHQYAQILTSDNSPDNPAWQFALQAYLFSKLKNIHNLVIMPYASRLEFFADWFRQLWAESLGKNETGILPIKAVGPADQHSQLQFYNQGKNLNTYLFISLKNYSHNLIINNKDIEALSFLDQKNLQTIIQTEYNATRFSLATNGRPSSHLLIEKIDEVSIANLFVFFEMATLYTASLLDINPFDQPGVEQSKNYMYSLLGKPSFETYKNELAKYL